METSSILRPPSPGARSGAVKTLSRACELSRHNQELSRATGAASFDGACSSSIRVGDETLVGLDVLGARTVAFDTCRDDVFRGVIEGIAVNVVGDQHTGDSPINSTRPRDRSFAPVAQMRAGPNLLKEYRSCGAHQARLPRERMARKVEHSADGSLCFGARRVGALLRAVLPQQTRRPAVFGLAKRALIVHSKP